MEQDIIKQGNLLINQRLEAIRIATSDILPRHVLIVPHSELKRHEEDPEYITYHSLMRILLTDKIRGENPLMAAAIVIHEMLHFKEPAEIEAVVYHSGKDIAFNDISSGIRTSERDATFGGLAEGITEELNKRIFPLLCERIPDLKRLREESVLVMQNLIPQIAASRANGRERDIEMRRRIQGLLPPDEAQKQFLKALDESSKEDFVFANANRIERFSFIPQRGLLSLIMGAIADNDPQKFPNTDAVFDMFLRAQYERNLPLLRDLINGSFGEGSSETVARMSTKIGAFQNAEQIWRTLLENRKNRRTE